MNNYLEWQKSRSALSGVGGVMLHPTSRAISVTNPLFGTKSLPEVIHKTDDAFIARWLVYYPTPGHIQHINTAKDTKADTENIKYKEGEFIPPKEFKKMLKWMQSFKVTGMDVPRIVKIKDEITKNLPEVLQEHTKIRLMHHLKCLLDGIVKYRYFCKGVFDSKDYVVEDEDYDELENIMVTISSTWSLGSTEIMTLPVRVREQHLDKTANKLYRLICDALKIKESDLEELASRNGIGRVKYPTNLALLIQYELIREENEIIFPHWYGPGQANVGDYPSDIKSIKPEVIEAKSREMETMKQIEECIKEDDKGTGVPIDDFILIGEKQELSESDTDKIIQEMKVKGRIFEWKPNLFKLAKA